MINKVAEINDPNEIARLKDLTKPLIEPPAHLDVRWLERNGWVAVPVESAYHFDVHDTSLLAAAIRGVNVTTCFAIATEPLENFPRCFAVEATEDGLLTFSQTCAHFNFLLFPASLSFAVLCTAFDYFIVSGSTAFVESAVGSGIAQARLRFLDYASNSYDVDRLIAIAQHYSNSMPAHPAFSPGQ